MLDAAHACVMARGVRGTTFSDVARRAGISRMTLYRRAPDVTALLQGLMAREFARILTEAQAQASELPSARERVVHATVHAARDLTADPLFLRILEVDPELMLPYVIERVGTVQRMAIAAIERYVTQGVADGSVRRGDPATLAAAIELAARGFVFSARAEPGPLDRDGALAELRRMLDAYLRPAESGG